jgi:hypothetical protein
MGIRKNNKHQLLTWTYTNQTTSWLVCCLSPFQTNHRQTWIHKIHHSLDLGEATTFPLIVYSVLGHGASTKWQFIPRLPSGSPEILRIGTFVTLEAHNFVWRPPIKVMFKAELHLSSKAFQQYVACHLHARKLVLTPGLSFGHNLCFKCLNGSCKPIFDIYVPRCFHWYKEFFNPMSFDPWNNSLKIWKSIGIPTHKVGIHLGVWGFIPSHSLALPGAWNVIPGLALGSHRHKPLPWSRAQG